MAVTPTAVEPGTSGPAPAPIFVGENRSYGPVPPVGAHTQSILKQTGKS